MPNRAFCAVAEVVENKKTSAKPVRFLKDLASLTALVESMWAYTVSLRTYTEYRSSMIEFSGTSVCTGP